MGQQFSEFSSDVVYFHQRRAILFHKFQMPHRPFSPGIVFIALGLKALTRNVFLKSSGYVT